MGLDRKRRRDLPAAALLLALFVYVAAAFALCGLLVAYLDPAFVAEGAALAAPGTLALNALPPAFIALLLLALTRRPLLSLGLVLLALYALYVANTLKLDLLDTPLLPADFMLLGHLGDGGALLSRYLTRGDIAVFVGALLALALLLVCERAWTSLRGVRRALLLLAVLALGASLLTNTRPWSRAYAADAAFMSWSPAVSALKSGLPSTLLRYVWSTSFVLPEVDRDAAARIVQSHPLPPPVPAADEPPDIVVWQSESFFDPARLSGFEPAQALPAFRRLAAGARHGDLWVPTYGGGTIRTEFEVLTGIAMRYFPKVQYPYFRMTASPVPSLASALAEQGYRTLAVHPNTRDFWNRAAALKQLGFEAFDGVEQFGDAKRVGYYIGDEALVDHVLARLDAATAPAFVFAISIENHGPYDGYPNADPRRIAAQPVPAGLDGVAADRLRGYLHHLENADQALGRLVGALRQRPRRTLLLFYGDHLPAMPRAYETVGFDDGGQGFTQPVPWLLIDTAQPARASAPETTAAFYLPALLLDAAGIDDRGYFRLLDELRQADRPGRGWTPPDEDGLRAMMLLRQRGEFAEPK